MNISDNMMGALENYEEKYARFNFFDATGITHNETKHSNFLAFLLNPNPRENHGLGETFLSHFLKACELKELSSSRHLASTEIFRERHNIDLLLINEEDSWLVVIELKVWAGETGNQLQRYKRTAEERYAHLKNKHFIFLSPHGELPSDNSYLPVSFESLITPLKQTQKSTKDSDIEVLLRHYRESIEENILMNTAKASEAIALYQGYQSALDEISHYSKTYPAYVLKKIEKNLSDTAWKKIQIENNLLHLFPSDDSFSDYSFGHNKTSAWHHNYRFNFEIDMRSLGHPKLLFVINTNGYSEEDFKVLDAITENHILDSVKLDHESFSMRFDLTKQRFGDIYVLLSFTLADFKNSEEDDLITSYINWGKHLISLGKEWQESVLSLLPITQQRNK